MANFTEPTNPTFQSIRQIETNDPVLGGAAEIANVVNSPVNYALRAMVDRTAWLKAQVDGISVPNASHSARGIARLATVTQVTGGTDDTTIVTPFTLQGKLTAAIAAIPAIPDASTSVKGIVQLSTLNEATGNSPPSTKAVAASIIKAMIEEFAPMTKVYSGRCGGAQQFTDSNNVNHTVIRNLTADLHTPGLTENSNNHILIPSGETLMGGIGGAQNQWNSFYAVEGNRIGSHNTISTNTVFTLFVREN